MNFIVNSAGTCALRLSSVEKLEVVEVVSQGSATYHVSVHGTVIGEKDFEVADTLQAAQALALPILQALEA